MSATAAAASAPQRGNRRRGDTADNFRLLADVAPVMIWVAGPDRQCVYFNRPWLEFTGRNLEAELGADWTEVARESRRSEGPDGFAYAYVTYERAAPAD